MRTKVSLHTTGASLLECPLLKDYLGFLSSVKCLSDRTVASYGHDLSRLNELCQQASILTVTEEDIRRVLAVLRSQRVSPRSLHRHLSSWRGFYRWAIQQGLLTQSPVESIRAPKWQPSLPRHLSVEHLNGLLNTASLEQVSRGRRGLMNKETVALIRDGAMFELLYSSGLRVSELVQLDIDYHMNASGHSTGWLNKTDAMVTVLGKGQHRRMVPVGRLAMEAIDRWLTVRACLQIHDKYALFVNARGRRMTPRGVQYCLGKFAQTFGSHVHIHPHMLRHSFASHLLQSSGDIRAIQELLGHRSMRATQIYTHLDLQHLTKVYDSAHPRAKRRND